MQTRSETPDITDPETLQGQLDPMDAPVPGQSLTTEPKNANYESSAESSDPEQVIQSIIAFVSEPEQKDMFLSNMAAGMPVEVIVNGLATGGVAVGKFSPDVAEIIKPVIALYLIKTALEAGIPVIPFLDTAIDEEVANADLEERTMNGKYNHGFIAQEVKTVIDKYDIKDGLGLWMEAGTDGRQRLAESELIPFLVKAIQELSAEVTALKGE